MGTKITMVDRVHESIKSLKLRVELTRTKQRSGRRFRMGRKGRVEITVDQNPGKD